MRHFTGWTPPPHPIDVIPSIDPSIPFGEQVKRVILDFYHDNDLRSAVLTGPGSTTAPEGTNWWIDGRGHVDPNHLWQAISDPKTYVSHWFNPQDFNQATFDAELKALHNFISTLREPIKKAIAKRLKLGPLPENSYGDPVVIYYYDNDYIKRIEYPRSSISTASGMALDPNNRYWWKGNGIGTYQLNSDGTWGDEGFDWNKDAEGTLTTIGTIIMAIVGAVLTATGVGAAAGAAILAFTAALVAESQMIAMGLTNGDASKFLGGFIDAFTKLLGVEVNLTNLFPPAVTKATIALLNSNLKRLSVFTTVIDTQDFATAYATIQKQLGTFGPIDDAQINAIDTMLGGARGPFDSGYSIADYADPDTIDGVSKLISDDGARNLFKFGALLGSMRKDQKNTASAVIQNPFVKVPAFRGGLLHISPPVFQTNINAKTDLLAYVTGTLAPRYGLRF